jgi:hypothetical protein
MEHRRRRPNPHNRDEEQIVTYPVTVEWIMEQPDFALGFAHKRSGRRFNTWHGHDKENGHRSATGGAWQYERGRAFACLAPRDLPLRLASGRLNPKAVKLCHLYFNLGYLL